MAINYITIHDLAETTSGNVSENAEFIINNGTDAVVSTKAKLSSILHDTNESIANLDGDIVDIEADVIELQNDKMNIDHSNDSKPYVMESYDDGEGNGYILYSNGFLIEWGSIVGLTSGVQTFSFLKNYSYPPCVQITLKDNSFGASIYGLHGCNARNVTDTTFDTYIDTENVNKKYWMSIGYGA